MTNKELTKKEKLEKLDGLLIDGMIEAMEEGTYEVLSDFASVSNYLAKNNKVQDKESSSLEEDNQKKVKEAEKRRKAKSDK